MHVHLVVPDLVWAGAGAERAHEGLALPSLETLLARGRRTLGEASSIETWLCAQFGRSIESDAAELPLAPWALLGEGMTPGDSHWLCADPVHLRVDRDRLLLVDSARLAIDADEAEQLVDTLNRHFRADALWFVAPSPARWYLRTLEAAPMRAAPVSVARGNPVDAHLPAGPEALRWQAVVSEIEMLLHEHPVNVARGARGAMPINSVWLSGSGALAPVTQPKASFWMADDPLARGLCRAADLAVEALPRDARTPISRAAEGGVRWILLDQLRVCAAYGDVAGWREGAGALESLWFTPLLAALRGRAIGMITLHVLAGGSELRVETTANDLRYFWRRRKPLTQYVRTPVDAAA